MSTKSSSKELFGSPVPAPAENQVVSGSNVKLLLQCAPTQNNAPGTAQALVKRHVPIRAAKALAERLFDQGQAVVEIPKSESLSALRSELASCHVETFLVPPPRQVDTRAVRDRMGLSQEQFATEFGLDLSTLRNWEQGRSTPDTATNAYLMLVDRNPSAVRRALAEDEPQRGNAPAM